MRFSIIRSSDCSKYDFGNFLWSPDFFQKDKLHSWRVLEEKSSNDCSHYFLHIRNTINEVNGEAICYDLTDGLTKFLDGGTSVECIGSTKKTAIEGDFAISRLRSYLQEMGVVEGREKHQVFSTEFLIFRDNNNGISTHTLFALCMSEHVQTILKRGGYGTEHPRCYDFLLEKLPIPDCLIGIDKCIKECISKAIEVRQISREIYQNTRSFFLSELNHGDWYPEHQLTFVKDYSEAKRNQRIDAEYHQPKYDEVVNTIKGYPEGWDTLGNLVAIEKCIEVGSGGYLDEGIPFARVSNLSPFEITEEKYISEKLYQEIKQHQPEKGEILFSKDATPGIAYYLNDTPPKMIPSGGILRLKNKSNKVNDEYLTLVLNSIATKQQVERDVGGSVILHWRPDQVKETLIPILPKAKQDEIKKKIIESSSLREQSKHLLECAKRAVEIAIEKDEQTAIDWLNTQQ